MTSPDDGGSHPCAVCGTECSDDGDYCSARCEADQEDASADADECDSGLP